MVVMVVVEEEEREEKSAAICGGFLRHKSPLHFIQHTDLPACVCVTDECCCQELMSSANITLKAISLQERA